MILIDRKIGFFTSLLNYTGKKKKKKVGGCQQMTNMLSAYVSAVVGDR